MSVNSPKGTQSPKDDISVEFTNARLTKNGVPHVQSNQTFSDKEIAKN